MKKEITNNVLYKGLLAIICLVFISNTSSAQSGKVFRDYSPLGSQEVGQLSASVKIYTANQPNQNPVQQSERAFLSKKTNIFLSIPMGNGLEILFLGLVFMLLAYMRKTFFVFQKKQLFSRFMPIGFVLMALVFMPSEKVIGQACIPPTINNIVITQATCGSDGRPNNDAKVTIIATGFNKINISTGNNAGYVGMQDWQAGANPVFNIPNSSIPIKYFIRAWNGSNLCYKDTSFIMQPAPTCPLPKACTAAAGEIGGNVFRDFNNNGTRDSTDKYYGLAGVTVKAFDCNGALLGTTTTDQYGNYKFAGMPADKVRIEFGTLPVGYKPSANGTDNGTSTQFVTAPDCTVDYGVNNPNEYCQTNPTIVVPCYVQGPLAGDVLVTFPYSYAGDKDGNINGINTAFPSRDATLAPNHIATNQQIGTVYGIAYNPLDKFIYEGAFVKRKAQLGPLSGESTGAIYRVSSSGGTPTVYADLNTIFGTGTSGVNPHPIATANFNDDSPTNFVVYKSGLGDIEISSDFKKLYAVNLADKTVYVLPTDQTPTAGNIQKLPLTTTGVPNRNGTCPAADVRPFGLGKDSQGNIYLGGTCTGETNQNKDDLAFYVWKLNGTNWDLVFKYDSLNYKISDGSTRWNPWKPTWADDAGANYTGTVHAMGIISDIEFDGDDMVLGIRDYYGDIVPKANSTPNEDPYPRTHGDIWRACKGGTLGFILENNASCGTNATVGQTPYVVTNVGPRANGQKYYFGDVPGDGDGNNAAAQGALLNIPGRGEIMSTAFDPVFQISDGTRPRNNYGTGGVQKYSHKTGDNIGAYDVFLSADLNTFGKTSGLGDIEALCDMQPIEIGNRLWLDKDKDGVQDPCEEPIANVSVSLYDKLGNLVAQTTTDATGNYYFNETNVVDTTGITKPNILGPQANSDYFVVIGKEDGKFDKTKSTLTSGSSTLNLTVANSTTNNGNDQNDSDAQTSGIVGIPSALNGYPVIAVKTPLSGSDHTFDAGFYCVKLNAGSDVAFCQPIDGKYKLNDAPVGQSWTISSGASSIDASTGAITGLTAGTHEFILKYTNTTECADTVKLTVNAIPSSDITFFDPECINGKVVINASFTIVNQQNVAKLDYISGSTFTGTKSYASLPNITPANSVIELPNPTVTKNYTIRLYNQGGTCFTDKTVELKHIDCPLTCPPNTCLPLGSVKN